MMSISSAAVVFHPRVREQGALAQCIPQVDGNAVFPEQVGERFVGQFLKGRHPVAGKLRQLMKGVVVEGDQLAHDCPLRRKQMPVQWRGVEIVPARNLRRAAGEPRAIVPVSRAPGIS
jgi:hypothetical protein